MLRFILPCLALLLGACTTAQVGDTVTLASNSRVALMPLVNHAQTPLAGEKAEDIVASLWQQRQLPKLSRYPRQAQADLPPLDDQYRLTQAQKWLAGQQVGYVLSGTIEEWRYKAGLDGEPVVAVTLNLTKLGEDTPVWTGTIAKSGWGRDSLAATAQDVLSDLLDQIEAGQ